MKTLQKFITLTLISSLVTSTSIASAFATGTQHFVDVNESVTYQTGIDFLATLAVISGNPDHTYKPYSTLNRAEMLKILTKSNVPGTPPSPAKTCFDDVPLTAWYTPYVCYGKQQGWVIGYDNGKFFKPEQTVNTVEAVKMTLQAFGIGYDSKTEIWYKGAIDVASKNNYIPYDVNDFNAGLRRDQMADMIARIIKKSGNQLDAYLGDRKKTVVTYDSINLGLNLATTDSASTSSGTNGSALPPETPAVTNIPGNPFIQIVSSMNNDIKVQIYDPYHDGGSIIDSYLVEKLNGDTYKPFAVIPKRGSAQQYAIDNINNKENYTLRFKAINTKGAQSEGAILTFTAGLVSSFHHASGKLPDSPSVLITNQNAGTFTVKLAPPSEDGGTPIKYYLAEQKIDGMYLPYKVLTRDETSTNEYIFNNLNANTSYNFRFISVNADGEVSLTEKNIILTPQKNGSVEIF